jgi:hypothetical protein
MPHSWPAIATHSILLGTIIDKIRTPRCMYPLQCCGARTYSPVNPQSFLQGTLVAQCAKCERWHKLSVSQRATRQWS